ncbi:hypothetical protein GGX14DRAFT_567831 [Mycena pura]|uniref:Uncharacterized protein n=1 Tax=Mycena pura TaxID=153505 RepID=A0AAD6V9P8_9AGAR|nr:hypothetical protein GGX14DRAFT_567831 [Mycena pura]
MWDDFGASYRCYRSSLIPRQAGSTGCASRGPQRAGTAQQRARRAADGRHERGVIHAERAQRGARARPRGCIDIMTIDPAVIPLPAPAPSAAILSSRFFLALAKSINHQIESASLALRCRFHAGAARRCEQANYTALPYTCADDGLKPFGCGNYWVPGRIRKKDDGAPALVGPGPVPPETDFYWVDEKTAKQEHALLSRAVRPPHPLLATAWTGRNAVRGAPVLQIGAIALSTAAMTVSRLTLLRRSHLRYVPCFVIRPPFVRKAVAPCLVPKRTIIPQALSARYGLGIGAASAPFILSGYSRFPGHEPNNPEAFAGLLLLHASRMCFVCPLILQWVTSYGARFLGYLTALRELTRRQPVTSRQAPRRVLTVRLLDSLSVREVVDFRNYVYAPTYISSHAPQFLDLKWIDISLLRSNPYQTGTPTSHFSVLAPFKVRTLNEEGHEVFELLSDSDTMK